MAGSVILENVGFFWKGFATTAQLTLSAFALAAVLGVAIALLRSSGRKVLVYPALLYIEVLRGIPLLMVIFWFYFFLPKLTRQSPPPYVSGMLALTAYNAAYLAEIFRGGVLSVPQAQVHAAVASGLTFLQAMRHVVLPQAIWNMLPAVINQFISLFKGTALVFIVGVVDFFRAATLVDSREFRSFEVYGFVALVYLAICAALSLLAARVQRGVRSRTQLRA